MAVTYDSPAIRRLGTVRELTLSPPGKSGTNHDSSQFMTNFSCVSSPANCQGGVHR
jgi:hypothetical protein